MFINYSLEISENATEVIKVSKRVKRKLVRARLVRRETFNSVIERLLDKLNKK